MDVHRPKGMVDALPNASTNHTAQCWPDKCRWLALVDSEIFRSTKNLINVIIELAQYANRATKHIKIIHSTRTHKAYAAFGCKVLFLLLFVCFDRGVCWRGGGVMSIQSTDIINYRIFIASMRPGNDKSFSCDKTHSTCTDRLANKRPSQPLD